VIKQKGLKLKKGRERRVKKVDQKRDRESANDHPKSSIIAGR
jgi:hypothetical protein